jgi:lysophospholipase L1-like esterase
MVMGKGLLDLSTYVAIGDSITSGYADGALYYRAQLYSYPNLLAARFRSFGGNGFKQALLPEDSEGIGFQGNSRMVLEKGDRGNGTFGLSFIQPQGDLEALRNNLFSSEGPFNNFGIPGLKSITTVMQGYGNPANGEGNFNPFFTRVASDPQKASVLSEVLSRKPSFFSLFIGNNDVLAFAASGGTSDFITPCSGSAAEPVFENCVRMIVEQLTAMGAKGVISSIPDISAVPYFHAIPYNGLKLRADQADELNRIYANRGLLFVEGTNAFAVQVSANEPAHTRFAEKGELILMDLLLDPEATAYLNGRLPIPKRYMLTSAEVKNIRDTIQAYNQVLQSIASEKKLAFVDTNSLIKKLKRDRSYDPEFFGIHFLKKDHVFSLDGVHLTPLGQALLANEFIKAINRTYHTLIPKISLSKYRKLSYIDEGY